MGPSSVLSSATIPNVTQTDLKVYPTQTVYVFQQDGIQLELTFSTPAYPLPNESPDIASYLPITFLTYKVSSVDGRSHQVELYYDNSGEPAITNADEEITWSRTQANVPGYTTLSVGTTKQAYLAQGSDRINWGYWYVSVQTDSTVYTVVTSDVAARGSFAKGTAFPSKDDTPPRACSDNWPVLAVAWSLGSIQPKQTITKTLTIAYDQVYSMKYFGDSMAPLWRHMYNDNVGAMLTHVNSQRDVIIENCSSFDAVMTSAMMNAGGANYTAIASLAWRQATGGTIYVWNDKLKTPWAFLKEISSDGDVSTVDVLFPASPLFVLSFPESLRLCVLPLLAYANNETGTYGMKVPYNLAWAPHHLGHWPVCDIQPNHQEQMPMEESGNILIMLAALAKKQGNVNYLSKYWKVLMTWGDFLVSTLPDPGNQLCTDDFEGPSPHNVNLAAKGIVGLSALAYILDMDGQRDAAKNYSSHVAGYVSYWMANASDGNHYRLQYTLPNTWSLKYNLMYHRVLGLNVFPESVYRTDCAYYLSKMNAYGIPLDNRSDFTKTDWLMWAAAMCDQDQFEMIVNAVYRFANETPDRVAFTDWYFTSTAKRKGFVARPVIGGLLAKLLM